MKNGSGTEFLRAKNANVSLAFDVSLHKDIQRKADISKKCPLRTFSLYRMRSEIREAAKNKVLFLVARPQRGGGVWPLRKNNVFLA